jgi:tetratricopeptide (TPR) repeat protein
MAHYAFREGSRNARPSSVRRFHPSHGLLIAFVVTFCSCLSPAPHGGREQAEVPANGGLPAEQAPATEPQREAPIEEPLPFEQISRSIATGKPDEALEAFEASPDAMEKDRILHARLLALSGRLADARAEVDSFLVQEPSSTEGLFTLSMIEGLEGNGEARKTLLEKIVALDPGHVDALAALGQLALGRGRVEDAVALFHKALAGDPTHPEALSGLGTALLEAEDYPGAETALTSAIAIEPGDPFSYVDRARARNAMGNRDGALEDLSKAIDLDPSYPWSFVDRGKLLLSASRTDEALEDFTRAIELDPGQFAARAYRAEILYQEDRYAEARGDFQRLRELNPRYYFSLAPLAVIYYIEGNWAGAAQLFLEAHSYQEEDLSLPLLASLAARRGGLSEKAASSLRTVLARSPADSWQYAVARYLLDPSGDLAILARIDKERNRALASRMLFYVAVQYAVEGRRAASVRLLAEMGGMGAADAIETRLARWELSKE